MGCEKNEVFRGFFGGRTSEGWGEIGAGLMAVGVRGDEISQGRGCGRSDAFISKVDWGRGLQGHGRVSE